MVQHHSCPDSEGDHKLLCPLTFTLIKDPTPLLNFFPLIASLCEGGICGMGRSLCSVLKESGKYSEKQTSIVSARHDIDIGPTRNGQWSYKSICLHVSSFIVMLLYVLQIAESALQRLRWWGAV